MRRHVVADYAGGDGIREHPFNPVAGADGSPTVAHRYKHQQPVIFVFLADAPAVEERRGIFVYVESVEIVDHNYNRLGRSLAPHRPEHSVGLRKTVGRKRPRAVGDITVAVAGMNILDLVDRHCRKH